MADYHVRAVQKHSKVHDTTTRHILECIALDIAYDDKPAITGYRSIAERVRINKDNVSRYINDLVASGELIKTKIGKYHCYNLNQELIPYQNEVAERRSDDYKTSTVNNALVTKNELDSQLATLRLHFDERLYSLSSQLSSLSVLLSGLSLNLSLTQKEEELRKEKEESKKESKKEEEDTHTRETETKQLDTVTLDKKKEANVKKKITTTKKSSKTEVIIIPDVLNTPEFLEIWKDFLTYRIEKGKNTALTPTGQKRRLLSLVKEHKKHGMNRILFELDLAIHKKWDMPYFTNDFHYTMSKQNKNNGYHTTERQKSNVDAYGFPL